MAKKKIKLFSDQKLRVTKTGRYTIGGKFVSQKQVNKWVATRKRRGKPASIPRKPKGYVAARKQAAQRGIRKRGLSLSGVEFLGKRTTRVGKFPQRVYEIQSPEIATIAALSEIETANRKFPVVVWGVAWGVDKESNEFTMGTKAKDARDADTPNDLAADLLDLMASYEVVEVTKIEIVFSFAIKEKV